jgi:hypothetical protein
MACGAIDVGAITVGAPDQIGIESDDRVTAAGCAAFDGFQQKAVGFAFAELEKRRDRRFEVGDERRPNHLRLPARILLGERGLRRLDMHD